MNRQDCADLLKQAIDKVRKYDEELAEEILACLMDYEIAWRKEYYWQSMGQPYEGD